VCVRVGARLARLARLVRGVGCGVPAAAERRARPGLGGGGGGGEAKRKRRAKGPRSRGARAGVKGRRDPREMEMPRERLSLIIRRCIVRRCVLPPSHPTAGPSAKVVAPRAQLRRRPSIRGYGFSSRLFRPPTEPGPRFIFTPLHDGPSNRF
jgi:hypothetical protein